MPDCPRDPLSDLLEATSALEVSGNTFEAPADHTVGLDLAAGRDRVVTVRWPSAPDDVFYMDEAEFFEATAVATVLTRGLGAVDTDRVVFKADWRLELVNSWCEQESLLTRAQEVQLGEYLDGVTMEYLRGSPSIDIAIKRYRLRKALGC